MKKVSLLGKNISEDCGTGSDVEVGAMLAFKDVYYKEAEKQADAALSLEAAIALKQSMSSIKRDVKKKAPPRPEPRFFLEIQPT